MFSSKILAKALYSLIADDGRDANTVLNNFLALLKRHHATALARQVLNNLQIEHDRRMTASSLSLAVVAPVNDSLMEQIKDYLNVPKDTPAILAKDASIIGGFVASWQGKAYDASVKTQLVKLREQLIS